MENKQPSQIEDFLLSSIPVMEAHKKLKKDYAELLEAYNTVYLIDARRDEFRDSDWDLKYIHPENQQ